MTKEQKKLIYLDHSATTPVDPMVAEVVKTTMLEKWGNPSSLYAKGGEAKLVLENAREQVASLLNAQPENVFFTSGGTEADNLALFGIMRMARENGTGSHLITTQFEHSAIMKTAAKLEKEGFDVTYLSSDHDGFINLQELKDSITDQTALVSIMHINNEIGTIQPIRECAEICREAGVLFHTDAVQSFGKIPVDVGNWPIDLVSVSSHKIYGPKGVGAIYIRSGIAIEPVARGGGQERNIRTGTENMPGIAGFGEAVRICSEKIKTENNHLTDLRNKMLTDIRELVDGIVQVNGSLENRLGANLNLSFPGVEGESLLLALDLDGIAVSTGSACSSGSTKPSHVLTSIGLDDRTAQSSIRITLGRSSNEEDLHFTAERIADHVNRFRAMAF